MHRKLPGFIIILVILFVSVSQVHSQKPIKVGSFQPTIITPTKAPFTPTPTIGSSNNNQVPTSTPATGSDRPQDLVNSVTEKAVLDHLRRLVDDDDTQIFDEKQTRYTGSGGNAVEARYIRSHFEGLGLSTSLQTFTAGSKSTSNIVGRLEGTSPDTYLVTAHMDSTAQTNSGVVDPAPGADDNASGTVAVMEAASALSGYSGKFSYSLEFIAFSGEEQGLLGSYYYARNLGGKAIKGVINLDMIGNSSGASCVNFGYKNYNGGDVISTKILESISAYSIPLSSQQIATSVGRSDHKPFWDRGIPAVFGHECSFSPVYHSINDTIGRVSVPQITYTAKAVVGALYELAK